MRFDLTDLRLFLNICEAGTITGGAERTHITLQAASERIRGMEDELGVPLLHRSKSGAQVTDAGRALEHHARTVLQHRARVMLERAAGIGHLRAGLAPVQQRHAEFVLHPANALACCLQRDVRALGAARDRAGLADVQEEPQVGQVESHGGVRARKDWYGR